MQAAHTEKHNRLGKDVFKAIFLILAWLIIFSLAKDVLHIEEGFGRVKETKIRLKQEEQSNVELTKKYETVRTEEYREKMIREQLNMQKEGEVIAVLPKKLGGSAVPEIKTKKEMENWRKWLELIL